MGSVVLNLKITEYFYSFNKNIIVYLLEPSTIVETMLKTTKDLAHVSAVIILKWLKYCSFLQDHDKKDPFFNSDHVWTKGTFLPWHFDN